MKSIWRRHLIICLGLWALAVPIYWVDRALLGKGTGGGTWIALDFRGLLFWFYLSWLAIYFVLSSITIAVARPKRTILTTIGVMVLSVVLLVAGLVGYGQVRRWAANNSYRALMQSRRALRDVIELKEWRYYPDDISPTEIRVKVTVHDSGRFAGNVTGDQTDGSGSSTTVFQSANEPSDQRQVKKGDTFTYIFPLQILQKTSANDVHIALYLFQAPSGPAPGDVEKIFMNSPREDDDGQYFYGALPSPSDSSR